MSTGQITMIYAVILVVLLLLLYFGFLRPDAKAKKQKQALQSNLKVGERVYAKAGICGVIKELKGGLVLIEVGEAKTELEVARWAILDSDFRKLRGNTRGIPLNRDNDRVV